MIIFKKSHINNRSRLQQTISKHDNCLEDKREEHQKCSVLCCMVLSSTAVYSDKYTHMYQHVSQLTVGLGLVLISVFFASLCIQTALV